MEVIDFVCPLCKGRIELVSDAYVCRACGRAYPIICGIADFRVLPDRYISIEDDRRKGLRLFAETAHRSFTEMLDFYYSITPEVPVDLARKFIMHALAEVVIGDAVLDEIGDEGNGRFLDAGCSTGGLVVAAARRRSNRPSNIPSAGALAVTGLDVAFRWLIVGAVRLREAGVEARLVCGNAEYLPFASGSFATVTCTDVLEHVADPSLVCVELRRAAVRGGTVYVSTNNRYALAPEPHTNVWGVGWLPRAMQADYVRFACGRAYRNITLRSASELDRWAQNSGFSMCRARPACLPGIAQSRSFAFVQTLYNRFRCVPVFSRLLRWIGPRLQLLCRK
jgi:ubiquinone/menaquinone biosynthesis C-methylase UbiE/uncharacterized protein YbaR (Trm112 family)